MPVIAFVSPKGGAGKTTSCFIFASILAEQGVDVHVIDADPNYPFIKWEEQGGHAPHLTISKNVKEETLIDEIEAAEKTAQFVLVDIEGTANLKVTYACSKADLVIIPMQRSVLDATSAARAVQTVQTTSKMSGRQIQACLLFTRTSPAIRTKRLREMQNSLRQNAFNLFNTEIYEREAFKAIFDYSKTLDQLPNSVTGKEKALVNARDFVFEALDKMGLIEKDESEAA